MSLKEKFDGIAAQGATVGAKPYLVLDTAWQQELATSIRDKGPEGWEPLLGSPGERKQDAHYRTPLLVDLTVHSEALDIWLEEGFPEKLGIVVFSKATIEELRTSLKRFISVFTPESRKLVYLRFYDARVLYCFLRFGFAEQWQDFFKNIELIAAPYDYTTSFAIYRLRDDVLRVGVETQDGKDYRWFTHENKDRAVQNYRATFPFREIEQRQFDDMMFCAQQSFYHEIEQFLRKAFPRETKGIQRKDLIEFIGQQDKEASSRGYIGRKCSFYWITMTMICGVDFHEDVHTARYLSIPWYSKQRRIFDILVIANDHLKNPHIAELLKGVS